MTERREVGVTEEAERKTARQAAVEVLERAGEPLQVAEIARRVLGLEGVRLGGKTPRATVAALLAVENKKPAGLFVRVAPGRYGLRERSGA
jgi:restriction system protein